MLTAFILKKFWLPVGAGIKPDEEVSFISRFVLGDAAGATVAKRIDATLTKLSGKGWFDRLSLTCEQYLVEPAEIFAQRRSPYQY